MGEPVAPIRKLTPSFEARRFPRACGARKSGIEPGARLFARRAANFEAGELLKWILFASQLPLLASMKLGNCSKTGVRGADAAAPPPHPNRLLVSGITQPRLAHAATLGLNERA